MNKTLLLVDDEAFILQSLRRLFRSEGYALLTATSGEEALSLLAENDVQVILSDQRMPGMTGVEFLTRAREMYPDSVRMVLSGYADIEAITAAVNAGNVHNFLFKPWDNERLLAVVRQAFTDFVLSPNAARFHTIFANRQALARSLNNLLIVDDEEGVISSLLRLFHNENYYLLTAKNGEEALRLLSTHSVQVIITDQRMPGMTGIELLDRVCELYPNTVRIVMSGYADTRVITDAINQDHIYKFIFKPWDNEQLLANVREAFAVSSLADKGAQFFRIYENTAEGIVITDKNSSIQAVNRAFTSITGYPASEAIDQTPAILKSDQHDESFYQALWSNLQTKGKWAGEIMNRRKNSEIYPAWLTITAIRDSAGHVSHYIGQFSDLSEHKREEQRLRDQEEDLDDPFEVFMDNSAT